MKKSIFYNNVSKCKQNCCKLFMLYKKAKNAEGKEVARNLFRHPRGDFRHPLKIYLPSPEINPETAPAPDSA